MKKMYCLVVTNDYSRFIWVFFLATKDENSSILKSFITGIENLVDHKVKIIRCDKETEFKNREMNQFCEIKGILRQFSVARTPQQNGVAKRRNRTLIEAARTMLADSKTPTLSFMRPFGCPVTILNTIDHLGKFDGKADKGFFVGYSLNSKSFRVFNSRTRIVEENLHIRFSKSTPNAKEDNVNSTNNVNTVSSTVNVASINEVNAVGGKISIELLFDLNIPALEDYNIFDFSRDDEDDGAMADMNNLDTTIQVSPNLTTRIHKGHPLDQVIGNLQSTTQTRKMSKNLEEHGRTQKGNSCIEGSKLDRGYAGRASTIQVTRSLDFSGLPNGKRAIGSKWVFRNKKYEWGIVIRNKESLVAQGYTQEEGIDYDEVFAHVARIKAIMLFLAYASFKDFMVYEMDVKSDFLYGKIKEKVYMSSMGEITFFLGLQVKQKKDDIFISQDKYVEEILKKFGFTEVKTVSTPMETQKPLLKDEDGKEVDVHMYRYQVNPKVSHLHAMKRIFRYLKGQPNLSLWYLKDSLFDLVAYIDSDYAGVSLNMKSITGDCQFLGYKAIPKELGDSLVRAATTASSLEIEQDSGNINKTQSKATPNESSSLRTTSGGGPRCQETMGDTIAQTRFLDLEKTKTTQHNGIASSKKRVKKLEMKDRSRTHKLKRLYKVGLTAWVESSSNEESLGEDASKQGRIDAIDADEEITLVSVQNVDEEMFDVNVFDVSIVGATTIVSAATTTTDDDGEITLAQALRQMKSTKPKVKGVVIPEPGESTTTKSLQLFSHQSQDKAKGILIEPVEPMKKKDQIKHDEETALKLQAEFDEEDRFARDKAEKEKEANIGLIET
ncbi:retrovirus-related pol polyprotein from transposon TNT 1-94 [Tanacetum coccineum]